MIPLRLVLDTNILVSAALKPDGLQRTVLLLAVTPPARLYVSDAIFEEYRAVLARPKLRIRKGLQRQLLQLVRNCSHSVTVSRPLLLTPETADDAGAYLSRNILNSDPAWAGGTRAVFHTGSAAMLDDVVNLYQRLSIGLTDPEKGDLVAFLKTL